MIAYPDIVKTLTMTSFIEDFDLMTADEIIVDAFYNHEVNHSEIDLVRIQDGFSDAQLAMATSMSEYAESIADTYLEFHSIPETAAADFWKMIYGNCMDTLENIFLHLGWYYDMLGHVIDGDYRHTNYLQLYILESLEKKK